MAIVGRAAQGIARAVGLPALMVLVLVACGQKGNLVLPTEAAAKDRATLPQTLLPIGSTSTPAPSPATAPLPAAPASAAR